MARPSYSWWLEETDEHNAVCLIVEKMRETQTWRYEQIEMAVCLYDDAPLLGLSPGTFNVQRIANPARLAFNVVKSCCNTVRSEAVQSRPRPFFLTSGGDWSLQRRAKKMNKFLEGQLYECKIDRVGSKCVLDALVCGNGVAKIFEEGGKVCIERIPPWELFVEDRNGYYGDPRAIYHAKFVDRERLKKLFPEHEEAIEACKRADDGVTDSDMAADHVQVIEAWHLRSTDKSSDGKHVICIQNATLFSEEWEDDSFPFAFLPWSDPLQGFWSQGLATELMGIQAKLNKTLRAIDQGQHLSTHGTLWLERGSKIVKSHISNELGAIGEYTGKRPERDTAPIIPRELYDWARELFNKAFEVSGVSAMAARSEKPAGLTSGKALRIYSDQQSKRFIDFNQSHEAFIIAISEQVVCLMRRLAEKDPSYNVVYRGRHNIERLEWEDVHLEAESYVLKCYPVSALPNTPAGRLEALQEMVNSGFAAQLGLDPASIAKLLDFPDLESATNALTAPLDLIEQLLERMLDTGEPEEPEPFYDLRLCVLQGGLAYQQAKLQGAPEDRLQLLRGWVSSAQALMAPPAPPAGAAALGPQGPSADGGPSSAPAEGGAPQPAAMAA